MPDGYLEALQRLALALADYHARTGDDAVLVGGAAVTLYTAGWFPSGDFDLVAASTAVFDAVMAGQEFRSEDRPGRLRIGYYHPDHPGFGFQQVSGPLFGGRADPRRLVRMRVSLSGRVTLPAIEDLIADRLGQHAIASPTDTTRLDQAQVLFSLADSIDTAYLVRRITEDGGDLALLGLTEE